VNSLEGSGVAGQGQAQRIEAVLRKQIEGGELSPGAKVGSEAQLAAEFGVARGTVRAAMSALERAGLIEAVPAKGRYVRGSIGSENRSTPAKRAHEVAVLLREEIAVGQHPAGRSFLSEKAVCERFGVSRYASRLALSELEALGLIVAIHGKGRLVADPAVITAHPSLPAAD
jgi:DNA-binding GntR family transcriptional regulator